jgi:hypothetical protein
MTGVASVSWSTSYLPSGHIIFTGFASAVEQDGGS